MNHDLYFIPILAKALQQANPRQSLERAFALIEHLGHQKGYEGGYHSFREFVSAACVRWELLQESAIRTLILERAAGQYVDAEDLETLLQAQIGQNPQLEQEYEALCQEFAPHLFAPRGFGLQLYRDGQSVGEARFETVRGRGQVEGISTGRYTLKTDTGLVLWAGDLTDKDLIWTKAFEGKSLPLAAEAGEIVQLPTREIALAEAGVVLRVFPGIESGTIEIELNG